LKEEKKTEEKRETDRVNIQLSVSPDDDGLKIQLFPALFFFFNNDLCPFSRADEDVCE
jgi:hypothetical protein